MRIDLSSKKNIFSDQEIELKSKNFIFGKNGSGKTTLCDLIKLQKHYIKIEIDENGQLIEEWKLPGNHVKRDECIDETAARILKEQTGLEDIFAKQFHVFSSLDRLTRRPQDYEWVKPRLMDERVITVGFYSLVNIDSLDNSNLIADAKWENVNYVTDLMFDHKEILEEALL